MCISCELGCERSLYRESGDDWFLRVGIGGIYGFRGLGLGMGGCSGYSQSHGRAALISPSSPCGYCLKASMTGDVGVVLFHPCHPVDTALKPV